MNTEHSYASAFFATVDAANARMEAARVRVIIYGVGAMARVLYSYLRRDPAWRVVAFTCDDEFCTSHTFCGLPLVPWRTVQHVYPPETHRMIMAVGYVQMNLVRQLKHNEGLAKDYEFVSYVHPSVMIHDDVTIGANVIIYDYSTIHPGAKIGNGTFIACNANVGHDCLVGNYCWINSGSMLAGGAKLGDNSFMGVSSSIAHGAKVGESNFIGANVMISEDTEDGAVWLPEKAVRHPMTSRQFVEVFK